VDLAPLNLIDCVNADGSAPIAAIALADARRDPTRNPTWGLEGTANDSNHTGFTLYSIKGVMKTFGARIRVHFFVMRFLNSRTAAGDPCRRISHVMEEKNEKHF
jgi:hypothetical protein